MGEKETPTQPATRRATRQTLIRVAHLAGGSVARMSGRLAPMTSKPTYDADTPSAPAPAQTILLIENDTGNRKMMEMVLLVEQFGCVPCANLEAGWSALKTQTISLIVVDLGAQALTLIARVRATHELAHIPIIVVTGAPDERKRAEALQAGAASYLLKPIPNADLIAEIRRCLDNGSA